MASPEDKKMPFCEICLDVYSLEVRSYSPTADSQEALGNWIQPFSKHPCLKSLNLHRWIYFWQWLDNILPEINLRLSRNPLIRTVAKSTQAIHVRQISGENNRQVSGSIPDSGSSLLCGKYCWYKTEQFQKPVPFWFSCHQSSIPIYPNPQTVVKSRSMQKFPPIFRARRERRIAKQHQASNRTRGWMLDHFINSAPPEARVI